MGADRGLDGREGVLDGWSRRGHAWEKCGSPTTSPKQREEMHQALVDDATLRHQPAAPVVPSKQAERNGQAGGIAAHFPRP